MQNYSQFNPMQDDIERHIIKRQRERFDPDGLSSFAHSAEAFGGHTLRHRIGALLARLRRGEQTPATSAEPVGTAECSPTCQVSHG